MIEIKAATPSDVAMINSLAQIIFPATYNPILSAEQVEYMLDMMYAPHNIEHQMSQGHNYFIAYREGEACGYLSIRQKGDLHYYIEKIYTLPATHGQGIGKTLFEFACHYTREHCHGKKSLLELNVNRYNARAISFYTKMGMRADRQTDEHVGNGYYANDYVMAINL